MKPTNTTLHCASVLLFLWGLFSTIADAATARPNILFLYTDDQAEWTLGCSGNPQAHTPHLDRLAAEGARFTQAFSVTPVCSPSRAELMTSRYGTELGILDFLANREHGKIAYNPDGGLSPAVPTFTRALADAGYQNALVGKWHLGEEDRFHPRHHGFHHFAGFREGGTVVKNPILEIEGSPREFTGLTVDVLTENAVGFLRQRDPKRPFFLAVHYRSPHSPWKPVSPEDEAPYRGGKMQLPQPDYPDLDTDGLERMMAEYLASVSGVDRNVGRLLETLRELKLDQSTIVIFSSDHGYNMGHNGIRHKGNGIWATRTPPPALPDIDRKYRPNLYDESMRVPLLIRWPGVVSKGLKVDRVVTNLDWFPTLLAMAGLKPPADVLLHGRDFTPLLRGGKVPWDDELYGEYSMIHYGIADMRCLRTPEWKLVLDFHNRSRDEFYDLKNDPAEHRNLIRDQRPEVRSVREQFTARLLQRKQEIAANSEFQSQGKP